MNTLTMTIQCSCPDARPSGSHGSEPQGLDQIARVEHAPDCLLGSLDQGQAPRTRLSPGQRRALAVLESAGLCLEDEQASPQGWGRDHG